MSREESCVSMVIVTIGLDLEAIPLSRINVTHYRCGCFDQWLSLSSSQGRMDWG